MTKSNSFARLLTISGFVASTFIIGLLFKVIHWPFGTGLLIISSAMMAVLSLAAFMYVRKSALLNEMTAELNAKQPGNGNLLTLSVVAALLGLSVLCIGILFKLMSFPGGGMLFMTGAMSLAFGVFLIGVLAGMAYRE